MTRATSHRRKTALPGELRIVWGTLRGETKPEILIAGGDGTASSDRHLLFGAFCSTHGRERSFVDELAARGYDVETLEFRIRKKASTPA